jgi:ATP-dependent exoDNAse (exonuclease V) alpha subunit
VRSGTEKIEIPLTRHSQFSLFSKVPLPVAEGDKMIWNRNIKDKGQLNNLGFVVERITKEGLFVRTESGQTKFLNSKETHHIEHAWALTIYKAQGQTAASVLQIVDSGTTKRDLLVGITRAAQDMLLVSKNKQAVFKSAELDHQKPIAADEAIAQILSSEKQKTFKLRGASR